jgi:hypothetical protein
MRIPLQCPIQITMASRYAGLRARTCTEAEIAAEIAPPIHPESKTGYEIITNQRAGFYLLSKGTETSSGIWQSTPPSNHYLPTRQPRSGYTLNR